MRAQLIGLALLGAAALASGCRCGDDPSELAVEPKVEATPLIETRARNLAQRELVVAAASQLEALDLSTVEFLDLAMSERDGQERPLTLPPPSEAATPTPEATGVEPRSPLSSPRCAGLDLHALAARAPALQSLRISGCQAAVHSGLSAFGESLRELELVDLELDAVTVARLSQLHGLERLTLTRVHAEPDALKPLGRKISPQIVVLRELAERSPVSEIFTILGDIREIRVSGPWVDHNVMIRISRARRLERLAVLDTPLSAFSLHQLKSLDHLHRLEWSGPGFNNTAPIYIRELPIDELVCNCPRFGDKGLHQLYLFEELRSLVLDRSDISSAGLAELAALTELRELTVRYCDLDNLGFEALSTLPLELEGFTDITAAQLATLVALERLELGNSEISDEGLVHLAPLVTLERLTLHHTRVTKHGLTHLAGMTKLEVLELDHTDVVDEGVAHLAGLRSLRELRLDHTLITDLAITSLLGLEQLERLNLAHTVVSAEGVAALQRLPKLEAVNLAGTRAIASPP